MNSNTIPQDKPFKSVIITKCLTDTCEEYTGAYINKILNHRLICKCSYGHAENSATPGRLFKLPTRLCLEKDQHGGILS